MSEYDKLFFIQIVFSIKYSFSIAFLIAAMYAPQDIIISTILAAVSVFMIIFIGADIFINFHRKITAADIFLKCALIDLFLLIAVGIPTFFFESEKVCYTGLTIIILGGFSHLFIDKYNNEQEIESEYKNEDDCELVKKKYKGKNRLFFVHGNLHLLEIYGYYGELITQSWIPGELVRSSAINIMNNFIPYKIYISSSKSSHEEDNNILFILKEEAIEFESDLCYQIDVVKFFSPQICIRGLSSNFEYNWCMKFLIRKNCCTELKDIPAENRINNLKLNLF